MLSWIGMKEQWKNIEGYDGIFQVSNLGRVRRTYNHKHKKRLNYIFTQGIGNTGYSQVGINYKGISRRVSVHRLVAQTFIENPDNLPIVNHKDFNKQNNSAENLEWTTQSENCKHAIRHGRMPNNRGEKHGMSKLTQKQVLEIRKRSKTETGYSLAKEFGVNDQTIYDIIKRRRWGWLK